MTPVHTIIPNKPTVVDGILDSYFTEMDAKMDAALARQEAIRKRQKPSKHPTTVHEAEILMATWEEHHPGKEMPRKVAQRCMDLIQGNQHMVVKTSMGHVQITNKGMWQ